MTFTILKNPLIPFLACPDLLRLRLITSWKMIVKSKSTSHHITQLIFQLLTKINSFCHHFHLVIKRILQVQFLSWDTINAPNLTIVAMFCFSPLIKGGSSILSWGGLTLRYSIYNNIRIFYSSNNNKKIT